MDMKQRKPKKTKQELIEYLRDEKGVRFNIMDEAAALAHLSVNNYLRTAAYRKNYDKYTKVPNDPSRQGKYINLEFAYLAELSTIDYHLRRFLLQLCIDVEHAIKVRLTDIFSEKAGEDGYSIVEDFFQKYPCVLKSINRKRHASFSKDLITKYFDQHCFSGAQNGIPAPSSNTQSCCCPIWVLMELIDFGDLTRLLEFCVSRTIFTPAESQMLAICNRSPLSILNPIRSLRNACAHNNCLLNAMYATGKTNPPQEISQYVSKIKKENDGRKKKLSRPFLEITCLFYASEKILSTSIQARHAEHVNAELIKRIGRNMSYFNSNRLVKSSLEYLVDLFQNWP